MADLFASSDPSAPIEAKRVASFACMCGARSEFREPCPQAIECWSCGGEMKRWTPKVEPPFETAVDWLDR